MITNWHPGATAGYDDWKLASPDEEAEQDESYCDGYGTLICHCGGDLCVCGRDGEDCYGCEKCEGRDDEYFEDDPSPESSPAQVRVEEPKS